MDSAIDATMTTHPGTNVRIIEGAEIGPGGGQIIFENDRVRVWELRLEPGERSDLHHHTADYLMVQLEGDEI